MRKECTACKGLPQSQAQHCHECKGVRYIEYYGKCKHENEVYEPMVDGWICPDCGASGPCTSSIPVCN